MLPFKPETSLILAALCAASFGTQAATSATPTTPTLAPWLGQIGETTAILSASNWGSGQVLGVVDTGITTTSPVFTPGQVSSLSACSAVSFRCPNGVADDNGHGTAVAAIAAANQPVPYAYRYTGYTIQPNSYLGVAPNATIVAEKALAKSGSGNSSDIAGGINKAVAAGASVINLSLGYLSVPNIITAMNNAAAKGVFMVWAGGNDSKAVLNNADTLGLTQNAINHLVLAGALDTSAAKLASFSNTPGRGVLVTDGGAKTAYASRWLMAPGTSILAPNTAAGSTAMASWSGTSMSAPLVSGSLLLLESAWPILKTNGTAANLLLATATDLGAKGVDNTYGAGLVNLTTAFQPVGALSVTQANGKPLAVSSLTGSMVAGGALGNLSAVQAKLANYTALDGYARNFSVNLSGLVQARAAGVTLNPLPVNRNAGVVTQKFSDGSELSGWQSPAPDTRRLGLLSVMETPSLPGAGYLALTDSAGGTVAMGYGVPSQWSFAKALYGGGNLSALAGESGVANLSELAPGGYHLAYGAQFGPDARVAAMFSQTPGYYAGTPWEQSGSVPMAGNLTVGLSYKLSESWTGGVTAGQLTEKSGLLGSGYDSASALSLGSNRTASLGLSLGYEFDANHSLLAEAGFARTKGAVGEGLLSGTTDIQSRAYGLTFLSKQVLSPDDRLTVSVKQPLRVVSGSASVVTPIIDDAGVAHYVAEQASLVPVGREVDFRMAYDTPLGKERTLSLQVSAKRDALNIAGTRDASVGAVWGMRF